MIYGYARISRPTQNIQRQARNILEYDNKASISREAFTGTTQDRPEWVKLRRKLKAGDTVIFDSVSRMSRNAEEGFADYESLYNMGISLVFIKEPHINTDTYKQALKNEIQLTGNEIADEYIKATNRVLMLLAKQQIRLAFEQAQKEVDDLHKRTSEGIKTAKIAGKQIGRAEGTTVTTKKSIAAKALILKYSRDFNGNLNDSEVMQMIGKIARNTYYKYKKELLAE